VTPLALGALTVGSFVPLCIFLCDFARFFFDPEELLAMCILRWGSLLRQDNAASAEYTASCKKWASIRREASTQRLPCQRLQGVRRAS
jgi:hypothetical protein